MEPVKKHLKRHLLSWLVLIFILVLAGGYVLGYRPGPGLTVVRVGTLTVTGIPDGTTVYTDQASRGMSHDGSLSAALVPGSHTVIVAAPDDEPWEQIVSIASNGSTSVSPILVAKKPSVTGISSATTTVSAQAALAATVLPTPAAPLTLGCAQVFVSNNRIVAQPLPTSTPSCATPPDYLCAGGTCGETVVYSPVAPLHSVIPFPNRTDSLVVTAGQWAYAIALDPRNPQFFAPIVESVSPVVAPAATSSIYLEDQGQLFTVSL